MVKESKARNFSWDRRTQNCSSIPYTTGNRACFEYKSGETQHTYCCPLKFDCSSAESSILPVAPRDPIFTGVLSSVATPMVVVDPPAIDKADPDSNSSDLRIVISRDEKLVKGSPQQELNAPAGSVSNDLSVGLSFTLIWTTTLPLIPTERVPLLRSLIDSFLRSQKRLAQSQ